MGTLVFPKHKALHIIILCFLFFSFACISAPSVTITAMPGVTVTYTPSLTRAPEPTSTIQPSSTTFPSATPTSLAADLGQVIFSESFNDLTFDFGIYGPSRIESSALIMEREEGYIPPPDMWPTGGFHANLPVPPGETTIILFKAKSGTYYNIGYDSGEYGTESLRRFSFNAAAGRWDLYQGKSATLIKQWEARQPRSDIWHYFSIMRTANGDIDVRLWERDNPEKMIKFQGNLGPEWGALQLTFLVDFRWGSFMLVEYQLLK